MCSLALKNSDRFYFNFTFHQDPKMLVDLGQVADQVSTHWSELKRAFEAGPSDNFRDQFAASVHAGEIRLALAVDHLERLRQLDLLLVARSSAFSGKLAQIFVVEDAGLIVGKESEEPANRCNFIFNHFTQTRDIVSRAMNRRLTPEETETVVGELVASRRHTLVALRALELFILAHLQLLKFEKVEQLWKAVTGSIESLELLSPDSRVAMAARSATGPPPSWGTRAFKTKLYHFARLIKAVTEEEEEVYEKVEGEEEAEAINPFNGNISPAGSPNKKAVNGQASFYQLDSPTKALTLNSFEHEIGLFERQHVEMAAKLRQAKVKMDNGAEVLLAKAPVTSGDSIFDHRIFEHILTMMQCVALIIPSTYALFNLPALLANGPERMVLGSLGTAALLQGVKLLLGNARQNFFIGGGGSEHEARIGALQTLYVAVFKELDHLEALAGQVEKTANQLQELAQAESVNLCTFVEN